MLANEANLRTIAVIIVYATRSVNKAGLDMLCTSVHKEG